MNIYEFTEKVLSEILEVQMEHLTSLIAFRNRKTWEFIRWNSEGYEQFQKKHVEERGKEELRGIQFIAREKLREQVIIVRTCTDLLEA